MVRERQATRTYTESEALDLSVRNLTSEWRPEIRRLVERDKRTGHDVVNGRTPTSIIRRIETASPDFSSSMSEATLDDEEINLMVRAISQNQDASSVCLGCHLPGHKLEDCNRFVDYIVAEGLAQRNPQLKAQIANSHKQFRSRLNSANTRGRPPPPTNRTMRRILEHEPAGVEVPATEDKDDDEDEDELVGFQQNSSASPLLKKSTLRHVSTSPAPTPSPSLSLMQILHFQRQRQFTSTTFFPNLSYFVDWLKRMIANVNSRSRMPTTDRWHALPTIASFSLPTALSVAPTSASLTPVTMRINLSVSASCIIISHAAISKQLGTDGYHMSSFSENIGHIHFPHRLRRSQDIHIILQPTASRGGLTFTEALIAPTAEAHLAPLPSDQVVRKLCTEHAPVTAATILDPIDGMTCDACHSPPAPNSNVLPASPDGNARPYVLDKEWLRRVSISLSPSISTQTA
ncbi:hypothetical protein MHU86_12544 [Fragilaria crotonensis]|nr:hypothetical protein MHU86_12544 [Fragilaria crotonensis]